jgi:hypothetical protein
MANTNIHNQALEDQFADRIESISEATTSDVRYITANTRAGELMDKIMSALTPQQQEWLAEYEDLMADVDVVMLEHAYRHGVVDGISGMSMSQRQLATV